MPSITTWTRLEPRNRNEDISVGLQARVHDPLWFLARQLQLGELSGEYAGTPVVAALNVDSVAVSRFHAGGVSGTGPQTAQPYDATVPLEALVEREPVPRGSGATLRLATQTGQQLLRFLDRHQMGRYRQSLVSGYPLMLPGDAQRQDMDPASQRFASLVVARVPDGARLFDVLSATLSASPPALPTGLQVAAADVAAVTAAVSEWLAWCRGLFADTTADPGTWDAARMEYGFSVSAALRSAPELTLTAPRYVDGKLEWHAFDVRTDISLGAPTPPPLPQPDHRLVVPAPVSFRGMPADRYWEFEDERVNLTAVAAGREDIARLAMVEFGLVFGNDWFVVPLRLNVGTLTRISSLQVTDTFGHVTPIAHYATVDGADHTWRMFALTPRSSVPGGGADVLYLPASIGQHLRGQAIEEILLMRDEMANMGWAIERTIESPAGGRASRLEAYNARQQRLAGFAGSDPSSGQSGGVYRLATSVPDYWIPLIPVPAPTATNPDAIRLRRGAMLSPDGTFLPLQPRGRVLSGTPDLSLYEEEVPRSGVHIRRAARYARWTDGSARLWIGRTKEPGRGEGSSGLRFDGVDRPGLAGLTQQERVVDARAEFPAAWSAFVDPTLAATAARRAYTLTMDLTQAHFPAGAILGPGMPQVTFRVLGAPPGPVPVEVAFRPAGSSLTYGVSADVVDGQLVLFDGPDLPLATHAPLGTWSLRLRNEADASRYPGVLGTGGGGGRVTWDRAGVAARVNVALGRNGATASASSTYEGDTPPGAANNGDRIGQWPMCWADNTPNVYPDWLQLQFAGQRTIDRVDVITTQDLPLSGTGAAIDPTPATLFSTYGIKDFQVQYWTGSTWTMVPNGAVTGNTHVWVSFPLSPPIQTDRIRVVVSRGGVDGYSRIVEVEAHEVSTGTNVALAANGGVATASSTLQTWPPREAIDGDRVVYHWAGGYPFSYPGWFRVDFAGPGQINEIDVFFHQDTAHPMTYNPTLDTRSPYAIVDFDVQYLNGANWVTVPGGNIRDNDHVWCRLRFDPVTTSAVRLPILRTNSFVPAIQEVEAYGPQSSETIWLEDGLPTGAVQLAGTEPWTWVTSGPAPFGGTAAHQSSLAIGARQHGFVGTAATLSPRLGDRLFAYAYLDPAHPPSEIMLQWNDGNWEHRAYWGANNLALGADGAPARHYVGPLPPAGQWVRLEVPAESVGLDGSTLSGMAFTVYGERTLDLRWLANVQLDIQYGTQSR